MMAAGKSKGRKNEWLILVLILCLVMLLCCQIVWLIDRADCVCSVLTHELKRYELDDRVRSICDCDKGGTHLLVQMTCDHDVCIQLQVFPDEGYYWGKRLTVSK